MYAARDIIVTGLEVFTCNYDAQAVIQPHSGGPLECGGPLTRAARFPCVHQRISNLQVWVSEGLKIVIRRRRFISGPEFEKMDVATQNMIFISVRYTKYEHYTKYH